jgi:nitronate monooxygenase
MFQTRVTEMLGIKYPIVLGGMMWAGTAELAAAVSNAGGFGIIAAGNFPAPDLLRSEIRKLRNLTSKPFGVNVSVTPTFRQVDREALVDALIEEGATAIETAGPNAGQFAERIKRGKIKWIHKCAQVRNALTAERWGADIVTVVGYECGGAPPMNELTTFILVPLVVDTVKIPGAALALGAEGIVMGTRFIATTECVAHPDIKAAIVKARETDTMLVQRSIGTMERVLRNQLAENVLSMEEKGATLEELREFISGTRTSEAWRTGDVRMGMVPCGQIVGLIRGVVSASEVIDGIVQGAVAIHRRLAPSAAS